MGTVWLATRSGIIPRRNQSAKWSVTDTAKAKRIDRLKPTPATPMVASAWRKISRRSTQRPFATSLGAGRMRAEASVRRT